jgi:DNA-binding response OmpR family regulator
LRRVNAANPTPVLLVEDDARLARLTAEFLGKNGMEVAVLGDGAAALEALNRQRFEVVLLDLMLPGLDGLEVCRRIRAAPSLAEVAVIMLTARGDDVDKIVGLELGADDYLAKPYNPRELLARIRAVLRRGRTTGEPPGGVRGERLAVQDLVIDLGARTVSAGSRPVILTYFEFELLATLARTPGRVLSREHLYERLKHESFESFDRAIDVHISKLRQKLGDDPRSPRYIRTVRGVGYVLLRETTR